MTFDFIVSWLGFDEDMPVISLSKPIVITKNSNPKIIADFLNNKIIQACEWNYLEDSLLNNNDNNNILEAPGIIVNYTKFNLF